MWSVITDVDHHVNFDWSTISAKSVEPKEGSCKGDSGGPLVCTENGRKVVTGLVSYGGRCDARNPSIYANVVDALDWIKSYVKKRPIKPFGGLRTALLNFGKQFHQLSKNIGSRTGQACNPNHTTWRDADGDTCEGMRYSFVFFT